MIASKLALALLLAAGLPDRAGERMEFDIEFKGMKMGQARITVGRPSGSTLPVSLEARTTGVAALFSFRQQLLTQLDVETGLPHASSLAAVEGNYKHMTTTAFDRATNRVTVREVGKYDRTSVRPVPPQTLDFVALLFALRSAPLQPGMRRSFPVLAGKTVSSVEVEVVAREKVGASTALKVRVPTSFTGEFRENKPTHVWLSDDARRVVVRIATDFAVGGVTASLVSYNPGERAAATAR